MTVDLSHHLSVQAKSRKPSKLKTCAKYKNLPDFAFLAGGLPLASYFAWDSIGVKTRSPPFAGGLAGSATAESELVFNVTHEETEFDYPLSKALQYGTAPGPLPLREYLVEHTKIVHSIPYSGWEIITTVGSTQAWDSCIRTFCDPGDSILVEKFAFSSALETARPQQVSLIPMAMDGDGIIPEKLHKQLQGLKEAGQMMPKLIYTVPTGQNPTGTCLPADRREKVYKIAQEFDIIIVEDEPYYFLQMDPYKPNTTPSDEVMSNDEFKTSLVPSFLSYDVDGRVLRLDSFSKVLGPGARIGWITGQSALLERFQRNFETSIQSPSGFSSSIVFGTLSRWGQDGFLEWLKVLRKEYTYKRNLAIDLCYKHLPLDIVTINPPIAGMFFTISIDASKHPKFASLFKSDAAVVETAIFDATLEKKAILVPGSWFEVKQKDEPTSTEFFFRGTYAATNEEVLEKGIKRFGEALHSIWGA